MSPILVITHCHVKLAFTLRDVSEAAKADDDACASVAAAVTTNGEPAHARCTCA